MAQSGVSTTISRRWRNKGPYMEFTGSECAKCGDRRITNWDVCPKCGDSTKVTVRVIQRETAFMSQVVVQSGS